MKIDDPSVVTALSEPQESDLPQIEDDTQNPEPDTSTEKAQSEAREGMASVFANPKDLYRYRMAKLNGATEEQALKVGDSGIGKWGDMTATYRTPIVALPSDTPGLQRGRLVRVTGPQGTVTARIGDVMPRSDRLIGKSNIDLNPAAAMAVGHPGGVAPVTWQWADEGDASNNPPGDMEPAVLNLHQDEHGQTVTDSGELPGMGGMKPIPNYNPSDPPQISLLASQRLGSMRGTSSSNIITGGIPTTDEQSMLSGLSDAIDGMKWKPANQDGSKTSVDGTVTIWPHGEAVVQRGGEQFHVLPDGRIEKLGPVKQSSQKTDEDLMREAAAKKGVLRSDFPTDEEGEKKYRQAVRGTLDKSAMIDDIPSGVSGDELLKHLTPMEAANVKDLAQYRVRPADLGRSQNRTRLLALAGLYDPDFDETKYGQRNHMRQQLSSTNPATIGGSVASLNTTIRHLETLYNEAQRLPEGDLKAANSLKNFFNTQTGKTYQNSFDIARELVANEMSKAFRGGVPTNLESHKWDEMLDASGSKEQLQNAITKIIPELLAGRLSELEDFYTDQMGKGPDKPFIQSKSMDVLRKIGAPIEKFGGEPTVGVPASATKLEPGQIIDDAQGRRWKFKSGDVNDKKNYEPYE